MKLRLLLLALLIYSITILAFEYFFGQDYVRNYLTDIQGDVMFYGVNTTLTTVLLFLSSYNFLLCTLNQKVDKVLKKRFLPFLVIQVALFSYLALDDRFIIHEKLGVYLRINDSLILLSVGIVELIALYYYNELTFRKTLKSYALYLGALFFGLMTLIDTFGGSDTPMRLSFEDLCKIWSIFFLFIYSYQFYKYWSTKPEYFKESIS